MGRDNTLIHAEEAYRTLEAEVERLKPALYELVPSAGHKVGAGVN